MIRGFQQEEGQGLNGIFLDLFISSSQIIDTLLKGTFNYFVMTKWPEFGNPHFRFVCTCSILVTLLPIPQRFKTLHQPPSTPYKIVWYYSFITTCCNQDVFPEYHKKCFSYLKFPRMQMVLTIKISIE